MTRPTTLPRPRRRTPPSSVTTEPVDPTDPTDSPTTTDPTTTTNTSTTTSTTVPTPTVEEQIAADYQLIYDGYWACLRAPLNCDLSWLVSGERFGAGDDQHDAGARRSGSLRGRGGSRLLRDRVDHRRRRTARRPRSCRAGGRPACCTAHQSTRLARSARTTQQLSSTTHPDSGTADSTDCARRTVGGCVEGSDPLDEGSETERMSARVVAVAVLVARCWRRMLSTGPAQRAGRRRR